MKVLFLDVCNVGSLARLWGEKVLTCTVPMERLIQYEL